MTGREIIVFLLTHFVSGVGHEAADAKQLLVEDDGSAEVVVGLARAVEEADVFGHGLGAAGRVAALGAAQVSTGKKLRGTVEIGT